MAKPLGVEAIVDSIIRPPPDSHERSIGRLGAFSVARSAAPSVHSAHDGDVAAAHDVGRGVLPFRGELADPPRVCGRRGLRDDRRHGATWQDREEHCETPGRRRG